MDNDSWLKRLFSPLFSLDPRLSTRQRWIIASLLFIGSAVGYVVISHQRHTAKVQEAIEAENDPALAQDKAMPLPKALFEGALKVAYHVEDDGTWSSQLLTDTLATGKRFLAAMAIVLLGIALGTCMGVFPIWEAFFYRYLVFLHKIQPLSVLAIFMIIFGLGDSSKIALVVLGLFPGIALDAFIRAKGTRPELFQIMLSRGASGPEIAYEVFQMCKPGTLNTLRLNLNAAAGFLIAGEALQADAGLGYRIFVLRRFMDMATIIPYVFWIMLLLYLMDLTIQYWNHWRYHRWA